MLLLTKKKYILKT